MHFNFAQEIWNTSSQNFAAATVQFFGNHDYGITNCLTRAKTAWRTFPTTDALNSLVHIFQIVRTSRRNPLIGAELRIWLLYR